MRSKRYYSGDDIEVGVTPSRLKRLGRQRQLEYLKHWFFRYFEDPVHAMPYIGSEGGYQYIWGGPYNAFDELSNEFVGLVPDEVIERAADEVGDEGIYEWAPSDEHPDRITGEEEARESLRDWEDIDDEESDLDVDTAIERLRSGVRPRYGDSQELGERKAILGHVERLEHVAKALRTWPGGIGHNNPPDDAKIETSPGDGISKSALANEIKEAGSIIRKELVKSQPDALEVGYATSRLKKIMQWLGGKLDIAAGSFMKTVGQSAGVAFVGLVIAKASPLLINVIGDVVRTSTLWLHNITSPF